jgi:hypothetical protein
MAKSCRECTLHVLNQIGIENFRLGEKRGMNQLKQLGSNVSSGMQGKYTDK